MRGLAYYEEPEFHRFLLSRERREIFPLDRILSQIQWEGVSELLDFGMGNGYFLPGFYSHAAPDCSIWGAECQEQLIDYVLQVKVKEDLQRLIPFYTERTEHPLLPDWIPEMDLIFCSCVMSTFADPALAIRGIGRSMRNDGRMVIVDWEKVEAPHGPAVGQKISKDRMNFFIEDAGYFVSHQLKGGKYYYAMEIQKGEAAQATDDRYNYVDYD
jgi:SAM-dependent methyltransferase